MGKEIVMGQELMDIYPANYKFRHASQRKFYLAINSSGLKVVRGSDRKIHSHAVISKEPSRYNGKAYATFTTRFDLAKRYLTTWGKRDYEIVEVKEITSKEVKQLKKEIAEQAKQFKEAEANRTAKVYQIERDTND